MGKATGVFLILAGIGTAALILPAVDKTAERQLADVVRIAIGEDTASGGMPSHGVASEKLTPIAVGHAPSPRVQFARVPLPAPTRPQADPVATSPPAVLIAPPQLVTRNTVAAITPSEDSHARSQLTKDIQRELKRIGCYSGDVSGTWDSATRKSMKSFIDRVNAALPTDSPDHILRAMVQGHPGNACGRSGTVVANAERSHGNALRSGEKYAEVKENKEPQKSAQSARNDIALAKPAVPKPSWETSLAVAAVQPPRVVPLSAEGRMSMGAPVSVAPFAAVTPGPAATAVRLEASANPPQPDRPTVKENGQRKLIPGAIAALSLTHAVKATRDEGAPSKPISGANKEQQNSGVTVARSPERPRRVARQHEQYDAPRATPYYVVNAPKYFAAPAYVERSSFVARFYERQKRNFDSR